LYFVAAIALFAMVLIVLNSMSFIQLPFISTGSKSSPTQVGATASPTPDTSGSDSARADRTLNGSLKPAVTGLDQTVSDLYRICTGLASTACFDSLTATDQQVKKLMALMTNADIPSCIRVPMTKMGTDVKGMDAQLQAALKGFQDNNKNEITAGGNAFRSYYQSATADFNAAGQAQKKCFTVILPSWVPD